MSLKVSVEYLRKFLSFKAEIIQAELEIWVKALEAFDARDHNEALSLFAKIADSSRILFNVGLIHANIGDHASAVAYYQQAQQLDQYFAISFFQ